MRTWLVISTFRIIIIIIKKFQVLRAEFLTVTPAPSIRARL